MTARKLRATAVPVTLAVVLAAAACGDSTTATTPEPAVPPIGGVPPSLPPQVNGVAQILSEPSAPDGYVTGENIVVAIVSDEPLIMWHSSRLEIEIGEHARHADFRPAPEDDWLPDQPSRRWRFEYTVAGDDLDLDGIGISEFALSDEGFFETDGVSVVVYLRAGTGPFPHHRVTRPREPRVCTDERELATNFSAFAREWDGAPFRVDMVRNVPDLVTVARAWQALAVLGELAEKIEDQLGYPIFDVGGTVEVPAGVGAGWDRVWPGEWETCPLSRDPGQILLYHRNDHLDGDPPVSRRERLGWVPPGGLWWPEDIQAVPRCGAVAFHLPWLTEPDPVPPNDFLIVHEFFHLFGFWDPHPHQGDTPESERGVPMSEPLSDWGPWWPLDGSETWTDIDALRCVFPEGG